MDPIEVLKRQARAAEMCGDFLSEALGDAVRNGDTDAEPTDDSPETDAAEEVCQAESKTVSSMTTLTVNGGAV